MGETVLGSEASGGRVRRLWGSGDGGGAVNEDHLEYRLVRNGVVLDGDVVGFLKRGVDGCY